MTEKIDISDESVVRIAQEVAQPVLGALDLAIKSYGPSTPRYQTKGQSKPTEISYDELVGEITADVMAQLGGTGDSTTKRMHGSVVPQRTDLGDGDGTKAAPKPGESARPVFYGGLEAKYAELGTTDAEIATNAYIAKTILSTVDPRTGRPMVNDWDGTSLVSDRLNEVMFNAATKALRESPQGLPAYETDGSGFRKALDPDQFVTKGYFSLRQEAARKAMTSTGTNAGDEWVPTFASAELWRDVHARTEVAANVIRVPMPTNPYTLPTETADVTFRYASSENTAVTASDVTTDNATLTARKIQAEINFSGEFTEDSIVPAIPALRANLVRRGAQTIDDLIVHGDTETGGTGNVNSDDGAPTAGTFYLALDGMRRFALVTNTGQTSNVAGALSESNFNTIRGLLGRYGTRPSDLVAVTGISTYIAMNDIDAVATVDKYGPAATLIRGELARIYNIPILLSEAIPGAMSDKVADDGKYTTTTPASNDTKGWLLLFNKQGWRTGFRREFQIESFRDIQKDQNILVASFRMALTPSGISTLHTAIGRNVTV